VTVSTGALVAATGVGLLSLALSANLGFYTTTGMVAVLVTSVAVIALGLRRDPLRLGLRPWQVKALLLAPCVALAIYLLSHVASATDPWHTMGYTLLGFVTVLALLAAWLTRRRAADGATAALIGLGCLLSGCSALSPQLRFGEPDDLHLTLVTALGMASLLSAAVLTWLSFLLQPSYERSRRAWMARWGVLLVLGGGVRVLAVTGSPEPVIDVHTWLTYAPRFLLAGENPYSASYPSPYGTERAARFHIPQQPEARPASYSPGVILSGIPATLLGCDARYTNIVADLLAALALLLVGRRCRRPDLGVLASGLYLCLPRAPFMIEQAWYEPQLAACAGLFALCLPQWPWAAALALGGLLSLKQYVVVLAPSLAGMCRRHWRVALGGLGVAALLSAPVILWDARAFWEIAVRAQVGRAVVTHALTIPAFLSNEFGWTLPRAVVWPALAVLVGLLGWRTPGAGRGPGGLYLAAALLAFNVLVQGFPNYYYLAEFLLLLGVVQSSADSVPAAGP